MHNLSLTSFADIYFYIAIFATIVFLIKLLLFSFFGGDAEVIADFNTEFDTDCSFDFISIQTVLAFFMGFGWMGYAGIEQFGFGHLKAAIIAIFVGSIFMFATAWLMFLVKKLEKKVVKDKKTAIGQIGKAYTNIAPKSIGQIEIEINGQLSVVDAQNITEDEIKAFEMIKVVNVENDLLQIEKVKE